MKNEALVPPPEAMTIAVRGFVPVNGGNSKRVSRSSSRRQRISPWTLIFDTETQTDAAQALRFGVYQIRNGDQLEEAGIFYNPEIIPGTEFSLLEKYAKENGQLFMKAEEFIENVFYDQAYEFRASIVGFNLPFDISRLAQKWASARERP